MNSNEKGTRHVKKGKLKQKLTYFNDNDQLLGESNNELSLERLPLNVGTTKQENDTSHTPAQWFSEWGVDGGEKERIEVCQSEAKGNKYDHFNEPAFFFY